MRKHKQTGRLADDTDGYYEVRFEISASLYATAEPSDYVKEIVGEVFHCGLNSETKGRVGRLAAQYVELGRALNEKQNAFEIFDSVSSELEKYHEALMDHETGDFKESMRDKLEIMLNDLLIIDRVEIDRQHRGRKLGLAAILRAIEVFGAGAGLVALKPFPLQFTSLLPGEKPREVDDERFAKTEQAALTRLRNYYGKLGFEPVPGSDVFVLSMARKQPRLVDLGL